MKGLVERVRGLVERAEGLVEAAEAERLVKTSWQSEGKADWLNGLG